MSDNTLPPSEFSDSDTMNCVVRMVIPMRREFGRSLDVAHFMHDFAYAKEVIDQAKISQNERLREYAHLMDARMFGPRYSAATVPHKAPIAGSTVQESRLQDQATDTGSDTAPTQLSEHEMRLRMMTKYKAGLR